MSFIVPTNARFCLRDRSHWQSSRFIIGRLRSGPITLGDVSRNGSQARLAYYPGYRTDILVDTYHLILGFPGSQHRRWPPNQYTPLPGRTLAKRGPRVQHLIITHQSSNERQCKVDSHFPSCACSLNVILMIKALCWLAHNSSPCHDFLLCHDWPNQPRQCLRCRNGEGPCTLACFL